MVWFGVYFEKKLDQFFFEIFDKKDVPLRWLGKYFMYILSLFLQNSQFPHKPKVGEGGTPNYQKLINTTSILKIYLLSVAKKKKLINILPPLPTRSCFIASHPNHYPTVTPPHPLIYPPYVHGEIPNFAKHIFATFFYKIRKSPLNVR